MEKGCRAGPPPGMEHKCQGWKSESEKRERENENKTIKMETKK